MKKEESDTGVDRWGMLRFSVVGRLLASPPEHGGLGEAIERLAARQWRHPSREEWIRFGASTIERWYYQALGADDPIAALSRRPRSDRGQRRCMSSSLLIELKRQYMQHSSWSYTLHADNLAALVREKPQLGCAPSYTTVRRVMQQCGWWKKRARPRQPTAGQLAAIERLEKREVRQFEASHAHALWHSDFHEGKRRVVDRYGRHHTPILFCVLDDYSRVCCHIQWYVGECAETFVHGLTQALYKRGLPRALMTDNGKAMMAGESQNGLLRLGIVHDTTLPYSAYQNGKQESFWTQVEGRLMSMLERVEPLHLDELNRVTLAWAELEYNRKRHSEIGCPPIQRMVDGPDVSREAPESDAVRLAFSAQCSRTQRRSDGTLSIKGVRFEVPSRLRTVRRCTVRYQSWNLSSAYIVDPRHGSVLARILPQDKRRNADGRRRALDPVESVPDPDAARESGDPMPPLLRQYLADYAATGLPPAYLPLDPATPDCTARHTDAKEQDHEQ